MLTQTEVGPFKETCSPLSTLTLPEPYWSRYWQVRLAVIKRRSWVAMRWVHCSLSALDSPRQFRVHDRSMSRIMCLCGTLGWLFFSGLRDASPLGIVSCVIWGSREQTVAHPKCVLRHNGVYNAHAPNRNRAHGKRRLLEYNTKTNAVLFCT